MSSNLGRLMRSFGILPASTVLLEKMGFPSCGRDDPTLKGDNPGDYICCI